MGNSQRIFAITVPNPTSDNQDPNAPPSYLAATVPGYVPDLKDLLHIERFKIDGLKGGLFSGHEFKIRNHDGVKILSARRVKSILTRGERYRDVFEVSNYNGKVIFKLIQCDDMLRGPGGLLLGYLNVEYQAIRNYHFKVCDKSGSLVLNLYKEGSRYNMVDVRSRQVAGYFEKRNSNGTKGWFGKNLDLGLKVGILSAAVTICREKHDRSGD